MTDKYKKNILDYITGNLEKTSPSVDEIFKEIIEENNDDWRDFLPEDGFVGLNFEDLIATNDGVSDIIVIYGGYYTNRLQPYTDAKGIIILLDNNFKPIKSFTKFESGTDLRYIQKMNVDETGQFYAIDDTYYARVTGSEMASSQKRFIMLNNIVVKDKVKNDYNLVLRKSYILGSGYNNFYCRYLTKNPDSAHYVFVGGKYTPSKNDVSVVKAISVIVNVGSTNEWSTIETNKHYKYGGAIVIFDSEDRYRLRCIATKIQQGETPYVSEIYKSFTGSSFGYNDIETYNYLFCTDGIKYQNQCVFTDIDTCYFILTPGGLMGSDDRYFISLNKLEFLSSSSREMKTIFLKELEVEDEEVTMNYLFLQKNQGKVYVSFNDFNNNRESNFYVQRLENDTWNPVFVRTVDLTLNYAPYPIFYVGNSYNLLKMFWYQAVNVLDNPKMFRLLVKENYNPLNYNSLEYTSYNSNIPKQAEIYSDNSLVFARNLYDITTNENQTVSTLSIPSTYINDIPLQKNNLLSETNTKMVESNSSIVKNIYEDLFVNYINTFKVIDDDTKTLYPQTAIEINNNLNTGTEQNYNNTFLGKVIIIFMDDTSKEFVISWEKVSDHIAKTRFGFYVSQSIKSIDFKSNDETITYLTVQPENLTTGSTYALEQYIKIV